MSTGGQWSLQESKLHINVLGLLAIKLALLTFSKMFNLKSIHFQVENMSALSYLMKMGGYTKQGDDSHFQRDLGIRIAQRDHDYRRVPAGQIGLPEISKTQVNGYYLQGYSKKFV